LVKRPWQIWTAYAVCLVAILAGMSWLSWRVLALDRAEAAARRAADEARQRSELQERVALALWRMDWTLAPLIAQEITRPSDAYRPFLAGPPHQDKTNRADLASPLLTQPSRFVVLNFDVSDDGRWGSPQNPAEADVPHAVAAGAELETLERSASRLNELRNSVTFEQLLERVPLTLLPNDDGHDAASYYENSALPVDLTRQSAPDVLAQSFAAPTAPRGATSDPVVAAQPWREPPPPAPLTQDSPWVQQQAQPQQQQPPPAQQQAAPVPQQVRDQQEFLRRNMNVQNLARTQRAQVMYNAKAFMPERERAQEGISRPIWIGDKLMLARRVVVDGRVRIQGSWLDWPAVKRMLQQEVADLFPTLDLLPVTDAASVAPGRLLATLPVQVAVPAGEWAAAPAVAATSSASLSAIRIALVLAWCCLVLGGVTSAVMLQSVLALSERRAAFVSAVTHELRSPLTTFRMYAEMLAEGMVRDDEQRKTYLETLRVESDRLAHLVDNVLQYARLERGRSGRRRVNIELDRLIRQTTERLPHRAKQAGMTLQESPPPAAARHVVSTDPAAVEQILFNLVDNACKYASSAQDHRIHVEWSLGNRVAQVRVTDHGPGIAPEQLRKLFEPFSKTDQEAAHSAPGIGLGLALCERLAKDIGGKLTYAPERGAGAAFLLELPLAESNGA